LSDRAVVFLNGEFLPKDQARISPEDRGFLLSDGIYEVTPFYRGVPFALDRHLARNEAGLRWMRIDYSLDGLAEMHRKLAEVNGLRDAPPGLVYLQVTRGTAPRTHFFPETPVEPTVYAFAKCWDRPSATKWEEGFSAVTLPDLRWGRVDMKTVCLLPNVLASQRAHDLGADDAILVKEGIAIEGTHMNFWGVFNGVLVTHPLTNRILPGVTRGVVLEIARAASLACVERPIVVDELAHADELFFTGTTSEVRPCTKVDTRTVGSGRAGPVTRTVSRLFQEHVVTSCAKRK